MKRYEPALHNKVFDWGAGNVVKMTEEPEGQWVRYEDADREIRELQAALVTSSIIERCAVREIVEISNMFKRWHRHCEEFVANEVGVRFDRPKHPYIDTPPDGFVRDRIYDGFIESDDVFRERLLSGVGPLRRKWIPPSTSPEPQQTNKEDDNETL